MMATCPSQSRWGASYNTPELHLCESIFMHAKVGAVRKALHLPAQTFSKALATAKEQIARSLLK